MIKESMNILIGPILPRGVFRFTLHWSRLSWEILSSQFNLTSYSYSLFLGIHPFYIGVSTQELNSPRYCSIPLRRAFWRDA